MQDVESIVVKLRPPTRRKLNWLKKTRDAMSSAVQIGLSCAEGACTADRQKIHESIYRRARSELNLPADYARMAINRAVTMIRTYRNNPTRKDARERRTGVPKRAAHQGVGLGIDSYKIYARADGHVTLRVSTGKRKEYLWLPLCGSKKLSEHLQDVYGDAQLFQRGDDWYVSLPMHTSTPTACSGEPTFIGIDLGVIRSAVVVAPKGTLFLTGKDALRKKRHELYLRRRYVRHRRKDRVASRRGNMRRWARNRDHVISKRIVTFAAQHAHAVIVMEKLAGIREACSKKASKRFRRMMAMWSFRRLTRFITYKAARFGIRMMFVDPRGTSRTCPRCGKKSKANRPTQGRFCCVACGYAANADRVAAVNIAAAGARLWQHEPPDTARPQGQTGDPGRRPDGAKACGPDAHADSNPKLSARAERKRKLLVLEDVSCHEVVRI